jgi:hypothetical protein
MSKSGARHTGNIVISAPPPQYSAWLHRPGSPRKNRPRGRHCTARLDKACSRAPVHPRLSQCTRTRMCRQRPATDPSRNAPRSFGQLAASPTIRKRASHRPTRYRLGGSLVAGTGRPRTQYMLTTNNGVVRRSNCPYNSVQSCIKLLEQQRVGGDRHKRPVVPAVHRNAGVPPSPTSPVAALTSRSTDRK